MRRYLAFLLVLVCASASAVVKNQPPASGGGGSGTVSSGTTGQVAYYSSSGTTVSGTTTLPLAVTTSLTGQTANTAVNAALFENSTAAAASSQQFGCIQLTGYGWKSNATATSEETDWQICNEPIQGTSAPTTTLVLQGQVASGGFTTAATFNTSPNANALTLGANAFGLKTEAVQVISGGSAADTVNGIWLATTSTLGLVAGSATFAEGTSSAFALQSGIAFTAPSTVTFSGISTGTNADFLCLSSAGVVLLQSSACTISSERFKENITDMQGSAMPQLSKLEVASFDLKDGAHNPDPNARATQVGLIAENVAKVAPECAIYENDMRTPKSYRQECVIALLVKASQEQSREIEQLKRSLHRR